MESFYETIHKVMNDKMKEIDEKYTVKMDKALARRANAPAKEALEYNVKKVVQRIEETDRDRERARKKK